MGQKAGREGPGRGRDGLRGTPGHDRVITAAGRSGGAASADIQGAALFTKPFPGSLKNKKSMISSPSPDGSKEAAAARGESKRKAKAENKVKKQVKVKAKEEAKVKVKENVKG